VASIIVKTAQGEYPITIGKGVIKEIGDIVLRAWPGKKAIIVTDSNVAPLYLESCRAFLIEKGIETHAVVIPAGESSKSLATLTTLYDAFYTAGLSRTDGIIALGGGVVGDVAGFAAATYLRGVPLLQVPTTVLAQVDAAIGGKTGIDMPFGKNMVGAFYPPYAVVIDPDLLDTLAPRRLSEGIAEIIKYGCIKDAEFFEAIETGVCDWRGGIRRCVEIKAGIVERDEFDTGERMLLNFGHTIGHALEQVTGFERYTHGEAVAIGMVAALRIGEALGVTAPGTQRRVAQVLQVWSLPVELPPATVDAIIHALGADKKRLGGKIHFVLVKEIGESLLYPMTIEELTGIVARVYRHA